MCFQGCRASARRCFGAAAQACGGRPVRRAVGGALQRWCGRSAWGPIEVTGPMLGGGRRSAVGGRLTGPACAVNRRGRADVSSGSGRREEGTHAARAVYQKCQGRTACETRGPDGPGARGEPGAGGPGGGGPGAGSAGRTVQDPPGTGPGRPWPSADSAAAMPADLVVRHRAPGPAAARHGCPPDPCAVLVGCGCGCPAARGRSSALGGRGTDGLCRAGPSGENPQGVSSPRPPSGGAAVPTPTT